MSSAVNTDTIKPKFNLVYDFHYIFSHPNTVGDAQHRQMNETLSSASQLSQHPHVHPQTATAPLSIWVSLKALLSNLTPSPFHRLLDFLRHRPFCKLDIFHFFCNSQSSSLTLHSDLLCLQCVPHTDLATHNPGPVRIA